MLCSCRLSSARFGSVFLWSALCSQQYPGNRPRFSVNTRAVIGTGFIFMLSFEERELCIPAKTNIKAFQTFNMIRFCCVHVQTCSALLPSQSSVLSRAELIRSFTDILCQHYSTMGVNQRVYNGFCSRKCWWFETLLAGGVTTLKHPLEKQLNTNVVTIWFPLQQVNRHSSNTNAPQGSLWSNLQKHCRRVQTKTRNILDHQKTKRLRSV